MAKFSDNDPLNSSNVSQDIPLRETAPGLEGDLVGQGTAETGVTMEIDTPPPLSDPLPAPVPTPTPDPDPRPEDLIPEPTPDLMPVPSPVPTPERPVIPPLPKPRKIIPELKEDYIKAYKSYFMHTGDHQVAKELGLLELRRSWAETSADGSGRLTKHAPELEYPSLSADAIKQRFETDLAAQGFDPETTFLKTDEQTRTESKTMHPTYALTVNGKALTLPDGAALRWKPNEGLFQVPAANDDGEDNFEPNVEDGTIDKDEFDDIVGVSEDEIFGDEEVEDGEDETGIIDNNDEVFEDEDADEETNSQNVSNATNNSAASIESAIRAANKKWPGAGLRITGKARTVRRQAELMARQRRSNRQVFLDTYADRAHITQMDDWVTNHPNETESETIDKFEAIIREALKAGEKVSEHLSDTARDISIPQSNKSEVRTYFESQGITVRDESGATGGPHWHLDFAP